MMEAAMIRVCVVVGFGGKTDVTLVTESTAIVASARSETTNRAADFQVHK